MLNKKKFEKKNERVLPDYLLKNETKKEVKTFYNNVAAEPIQISSPSVIAKRRGERVPLKSANNIKNPPIVSESMPKEIIPTNKYRDTHKQNLVLEANKNSLKTIVKTKPGPASKTYRVVASTPKQQPIKKHNGDVAIAIANNSNNNKRSVSSTNDFQNDPRKCTGPLSKIRQTNHRTPKKRESKTNPMGQNPRIRNNSGLANKGVAYRTRTERLFSMCSSTSNSDSDDETGYEKWSNEYSKSTPLSCFFIGNDLYKDITIKPHIEKEPKVVSDDGKKYVKLPYFTSTLLNNSPVSVVPLRPANRSPIKKSLFIKNMDSSAVSNIKTPRPVFTSTFMEKEPEKTLKAKPKSRNLEENNQVNNIGRRSTEVSSQSVTDIPHTQDLLSKSITKTSSAKEQEIITEKPKDSSRGSTQLSSLDVIVIPSTQDILNNEIGKAPLIIEKVKQIEPDNSERKSTQESSLAVSDIPPTQDLLNNNIHRKTSIHLEQEKQIESDNSDRKSTQESSLAVSDIPPTQELLNNNINRNTSIHLEQEKQIESDNSDRKSTQESSLAVSDIPPTQELLNNNINRKTSIHLEQEKQIESDNSDRKSTQESSLAVSDIPPTQELLNNNIKRKTSIHLEQEKQIESDNSDRKSTQESSLAVSDIPPTQELLNNNINRNTSKHLEQEKQIESDHSERKSSQVSSLAVSDIPPTQELLNNNINRKTSKHLEHEKQIESDNSDRKSTQESSLAVSDIPPTQELLNNNINRKTSKHLEHEKQIQSDNSDRKSTQVSSLAVSDIQLSEELFKTKTIQQEKPIISDNSDHKSSQISSLAVSDTPISQELFESKNSATKKSLKQTGEIPPDTDYSIDVDITPPVSLAGRARLNPLAILRQVQTRIHVTNQLPSEESAKTVAKRKLRQRPCVDKPENASSSKRRSSIRLSQRFENVTATSTPKRVRSNEAELNIRSQTRSSQRRGREEEKRRSPTQRSANRFGKEASTLLLNMLLDEDRYSQISVDPLFWNKLSKKWNKEVVPAHPELNLPTKTHLFLRKHFLKNLLRNLQEFDISSENKLKLLQFKS